MTSLSTPLDVVYITETIGGVKYSASGILISPDEVLTASHVVYTQGIGTATNIVVTPGGKSALGTYTATDIHYNPVADAGGQISAQSAQSDYAVIHLATPVDGVGYMGLGAGYSLGGAVSDAGFPAPWGPIGENSSGMAVPVTGMSLLQIPYLGEGSSGGPAWIQNSNGTGSVVATVSFSTSDGGQYGPEMTSAEVAQIQGWLAQDGETKPLSNLGTVMVTSDAAGAEIANLYEGILGRVPDAAGEVYYHKAVDTGTESLAQVAAAMLASPEFARAHDGMTDSAFVQQLYQDVLGRQGSAAEVAWYDAAISSGESRGLVAVNFAQSAEGIAHVQGWLMIA